ncbi:MAG: nodulation protein NfeD [Bacteroidales bacterium]|jgi:membrane-bound serine protease (ClpP class)|nr:nodulation protein NfeD [Bacteroidales bacterium]
MKAIKSWGLLMALLFGISFFAAANVPDSLVPPDSSVVSTANDSLPDISVEAAKDSSKFLIYKLEIFENITMSAWRNTQKALDEAIELNADLFLIHMNTYGGLVIAADSIRTAFLNAPMPVWVFIDNNAASAGALISIATDKIFMRPGGNIGAATVVSQDGQAMPDKYQSYMRATMRSTAEAQGKDTIIQGNDTIVQWKRNPQIAEAMVDPDLYIPGIIDSTKVLTFTASEAVENGYCDGLYESIPELLAAQGVSDYETKSYVPTSMDKIMGFLTNPAFKSFLIMFIIGGLYFELQSPGIGFPFIIAIMAALLYFAPSYVEGLANHWEILIFVVGVILIGVEIFVIPGFGIAGVAGIALMITGLALSMIGQYEIQPIEGGEVNLKPLVNALFYVIMAAIVSFFFSLWLSSKLFSKNRFFGNLSLNKIQEKKEGYFSFDNKTSEMIGRKAIVVQELRPSGRVEIDDKRYDAKAINGYIERDTEVIVKRFESGQLYVDIIDN